MAKYKIICKNRYRELYPRFGLYLFVFWARIGKAVAKRKFDEFIKNKILKESKIISF
jgi:hypothetical protein